MTEYRQIGRGLRHHLTGPQHVLSSHLADSHISRSTDRLTFKCWRYPLHLLQNRSLFILHLIPQPESKGGTREKCNNTLTRTISGHGRRDAYYQRLHEAPTMRTSASAPRNASIRDTKLLCCTQAMGSEAPKIPR